MLELEIPVIAVVVAVAVRTVALAKPLAEPRDVGEGDSEVIAVIDADTVAVLLIIDETVSEAVAPVTEPAVMSTR